MNRRQGLIRIGSVAASLSILFAPALANAQWAAPSASAPSGNAATPLNVGATTQTKSGTVIVGSLGSSGGGYFLGNFGAGASSPSMNLVVGNDLGNISGNGKGVVVGNTSGNIYTYTGQDSTHNLVTGWTYNATAGSAFGTIQTYSRTNPLYIDGSNLYLNSLSGAGNVGVATAVTPYKLTVAGDVYANGGWFRVSGGAGLYFESYGGGWYMADSTWIRSYGSKPVYMSNGFDTGTASGVGCSGGLGGSYMFRVCGDMGATAFYYTSDRNLKKDILSLNGDDTLAKVLKLQGVSFKWKDEKSGKGTNIGLIAQDVEKVFPEVVKTSDAGIKSVEYGNLVAPLIEAIKAQQKQIDDLKAEVSALKNK